jgi:hypothetical protein
MIRRVRVVPELVTAMMTDGYSTMGELRIIHGLPPGAVLVDAVMGTARYAPDLKEIVLSFDLGGEPGVGEDLRVEIQRVYPESLP